MANMKSLECRKNETKMENYYFNFKIINNSGYKLNLNTKVSSGITNGTWPKSINNNAVFSNNTQTGDINIKATAVYDVEGMEAIVVFHYYNVVYGIERCIISLACYGANLSESSVWCNNVGVPPITNLPPLQLSSIGNVPNPSGSGVFTVGPITEA